MTDAKIDDCGAVLAHALTHAGHDHPPGDHGRVLAALLLTFGFMLVELVGGLWAGSLALIADAAHMASDAAALILAYGALRWSAKPADRQRTFGYHRLQVLAAFANGLTLIFTSVWILYEAATRVFTPAPILGQPMLWVALAGLAANLASLAVLHGSAHHDLNIRGALGHLLGDILGSVAAIVAALVILFTGWTAIDPLLSALVALLLLRTATGLLRESSHILIEGIPAGLDLGDIRADLEANIAEVFAVHHLHAWALSERRPMMTLHARLRPGSDAILATAAIRARLHQRFGVGHSTIEIEP